MLLATSSIALETANSRESNKGRVSRSTYTKEEAAMTAASFFRENYKAIIQG